jgi:hypothetical protein
MDVQDTVRVSVKQGGPDLLAVAEQYDEINTMFLEPCQRLFIDFGRCLAVQVSGRYGEPVGRREERTSEWLATATASRPFGIAPSWIASCMYSKVR